jgi:hypothetical protein
MNAGVGLSDGAYILSGNYHGERVPLCGIRLLDGYQHPSGSPEQVTSFRDIQVLIYTSVDIRTHDKEEAEGQRFIIRKATAFDRSTTET